MSREATEAQPVKVRTTCYHCGDDCGSQPITANDKAFCCDGCKTVYEILNENGLCRYYEMDETPGTTIRKQVGDRFAFLDNAEIQQQLLTFTDGKVATVSFFIPAIHCSSCIWLLEKLPQLQKGVLRSEVNFPKKTATITFKLADLGLRELVEALAGIGYMPEINQATGKKEKKRQFSKGFYYRLGIAGFCFGNIMLLSIPEYLDTAKSIEASYRQFFSYLNLLLALPVFFYCSSEYFTTAYKGLKKGYVSIDVPISLGILTLFGRSAWEIVTAAGPGYMDSLAGLVFFLLIGKWYQGKTYDALSFERDYESYFPIGITRLQATKEEVVPLSQLQPHDRIKVRNQELIPADAVVVQGEAVVDYSFVTGESDPVEIPKGGQVYAGGRQMGTAIEVVVDKMVDNSYLTELWNRGSLSKQGKQSIQNMSHRVSKYFTIVILLIALATAVYWSMVQPSMVAFTVTAVLIVACPCALALSIPFTFGNTIRVFGQQGLYLKSAEAVEQLSKIDTIVFDKTGTITHARPTSIRWEGEPMTKAEQQAVKAVVQHSTHPLSVAIFNYFDGLDEIPQVFGFEEVMAKGMKAEVGGRGIAIGSAAFVGAEPLPQDRTSVFVRFDGMLKGHFAFENGFREGFEQVVEKLKNRFELHVLSGDGEKDRSRLRQYFNDGQPLNFRQTPQQKLDYIRNLQAGGKTVLMVGDGLNDAGALGSSDVGISISDDVYSFSPACDAILDAKRFHQLERMIRFSNRSVNIVKLSYVLSFLYNVVGLSFAITGLLTPLVCAILMPVSSVSVVGFVTFAVRMKKW